MQTTYGDTQDNLWGHRWQLMDTKWQTCGATPNTGQIKTLNWGFRLDVATTTWSSFTEPTNLSRDMLVGQRISHVLPYGLQNHSHRDTGVPWTDLSL